MRGWMGLAGRLSTSATRPLETTMALSLVLLSAPLAMAQGPTATADPPGSADWRRLAEHRPSSGLETATFAVGRHAGAFERLRLVATGTSIEIHEMRVYFADGDMQRLATRSTVSAIGGSPAYDLEGGARKIDRIELTHRSRDLRAKHPAVIAIWAEPARDGIASEAVDSAALDPDWELLGKELVDAEIAQNVIPIGRHEGRFDALRLRVLRNDVAFHDIRVVYLNGDTDTLAVRKLIRAGATSPPLQLDGEARFIREIELVQEANPETHGRAVVQVWARRPPPSAQLEERKRN